MRIRREVADGKVGKEGVTVSGVKKVDVVLEIGTGTQSPLEVLNKQMYIRKYRSDDRDVSWASKGLVVSVINGEVVPVLQRRIFDAGFEKLDIIPLGADKVLVRSIDNEDVSMVLSKASEFFDHFFFQPVKWNKDILIC